MLSENYADDLEKEIILMEQELISKRKLLDECRKKLESEISEHSQTRLLANKYLNENKELKLQAEVCLTGTKKLEEENNKNRDIIARLQVQVNVYLNEKQQLLDTCYETEKENINLKNEIKEAKEQLERHLAFINNFTQRRNTTETLVNEIITKQGILNKEQIRLETICNEGLHFAEKLSEEAKFQAKFIREAQMGQKQMEEEMIRLMAALQELKSEREKYKCGKTQSESPKYLEEWKSEQKEMKKRIEELQGINEKLSVELTLTREQIEILMKNYSTEDSLNIT